MLWGLGGGGRGLGLGSQIAFQALGRGLGSLPQQLFGTALLNGARKRRILVGSPHLGIGPGDPFASELRTRTAGKLLGKSAQDAPLPFSFLSELET